MKYGKAHVGKLDDKYYVSVRPANGSGEESRYLRDNGTVHKYMLRDGGTYFNIREEAQAVADKYNKVMFSEYKSWGELSDPEKGALLLAHLYGSVIQVRNLDCTRWIDVEDPSWFYDRIYRIKPEPVVEKVTILGRARDLCGRPDPIMTTDNTHEITFNIIDGEPDCDSVNMRKLWQT